MSRAKLKKGQQREFLNRVANYFNNNWQKLAEINSVCNRTLRDWRREKYLISYEALLKLNKISKVPVPKVLEVLPEYWSTKKASSLGGKRRYELYGSPGTPEGRRKGGHASWRKYKFNPRKFIETGFIGPKDINYPPKSVLLSELIGIILGDGSLTKYQVVISLNSKTDKEFACFILELFRKLFNLQATLRTREKNTCNLVVSSVNLTKFLARLGLRKGNKVRQQVNVPRWILKDRNFKRACLRGLFDTDGSFYSYRHRVNGKIYKNYALDFTNRSLPLLKFAEAVLRDLECAPTLADYKVILYKKKDIERYITIVGSSNSNIKEKFRSRIF